MANGTISIQPLDPQPEIARKAIKEAAGLFNSKTEFGRAIGCTHVMASKMVRAGLATPRFAPLICRATGVPLTRLRPDLYTKGMVL
ncbi:MAG: hypothetical protein JKY34_07435 [Kordiimonadaceae bacterium]|nr:hypothetical protein [Kordiimonadaceae bacterium]